VRSRATIIGLFVVSMAVFSFEILMSRLTSVALFYHLAFYVIANALLGGATGGIVVFLRPDWFPRKRSARRMYVCSVAMALSLPACVGLAFLSANLGTFFQPAAVYGMIQIWGVLLFIPFALGGVVVTLGVTRANLSTGVAYGANLLGAAAGCLAALMLLRWMDGTSAVLASGGLMAAAALSFARATRECSPLDRVIPGTLVVLFVAALILNAGITPHPFRPWYKMGEWDGPHRYVGWNSSSRVTVSGTRHPRSARFTSTERPSPPWCGGAGRRNIPTSTGRCGRSFIESGEMEASPSWGSGEGSRSWRPPGRDIVRSWASTSTS